MTPSRPYQTTENTLNTRKHRYQPQYFAAKSVDHAKAHVQHFCDSLPRVFYPQYDMATGWIRVRRARWSRREDTAFVVA